MQKYRARGVTSILSPSLSPSRQGREANLLPCKGGQGDFSIAGLLHLMQYNYDNSYEIDFQLD